jgi:hypothetical protein
MGQLITHLFGFPSSLPVSHSSIEEWEKREKRERTRKHPKREKREKREAIYLLALTGKNHVLYQAQAP